MAWFRRERRVTDEELLSRENPLLTPGEWEELLGDRRTLHHRRSASASREFRRDWKYVFLGAVLGAVVVGALTFLTMGISLAHRYGYDANGTIMTQGPASSLLRSILWNSACAGFVSAFAVFLLRRLWRRR